MAQMYAWSKHENEHVRRLASEGCRPQLPWGQALNQYKKDPSPILPILEQLKADPAALRQLMQSRDGQALMQALTRPDNGAGLQRAMQSAMHGDMNVMAELVGRVAQSPEGAALMERVSQRLQK